MNGGWEQVAALCRAAEQDLAGLTSAIVEQIRRELGDYASVPGDEHRSAVEGQIGALLGGLAARRRPSPLDAARAREVGARRARQGLPVEVVIAAYHIGYREVWNALVARAEAENPALAIRLLRLVNFAWTWVQSSSAAAADGHAESVRARQAATVELGHRFIEALYVGEAVNEETVSLCQPDHALTIMRVWTAAMSVAASLGLERILRRMRQFFSSALTRSPGPRRRA